MMHRAECHEARMKTAKGGPANARLLWHQKVSTQEMRLDARPKSCLESARRRRGK